MHPPEAAVIGLCWHCLVAATPLPPGSLARAAWRGHTLPGWVSASLLLHRSPAHPSTRDILFSKMIKCHDKALPGGGRLEEYGTF